MDCLFKTYFLISWGLLWGLIYVVILTKKRKAFLIDSLDFGAVFLSSISIIGGFKLIWITIMSSVQSNTNLEVDKVYAVYGGICVIWISIRGVFVKLSQ